MCLNGSFWTSKIPENDFTENLSDRKIMKFPHCGMSTNGKMVMMIESRSREMSSGMTKFASITHNTGWFFYNFCPHFCRKLFFSRLKKYVKKINFCLI